MSEECELSSSDNSPRRVFGGKGKEVSFGYHAAYHNFAPVDQWMVSFSTLRELQSACSDDLHVSSRFGDDLNRAHG